MITNDKFIELKVSELLEIEKSTHLKTGQLMIIPAHTRISF
jgi:hypothetical protein